MNNNSNKFIKDTIIKLLTAIGSEKEINKYIQKFSSAEERFAVIKVGGSVIENDIENLISSLVFLNQVGLRPIIIHGAGPMLTRELEKQKVKSSFVNGQRVTSKEVRDIALGVFKETNDLIVNKLKAQGTNAVTLTEGIFECRIFDKSLGLVGKVTKVNSNLVKKALSNSLVPVISPLGFNLNGDILNINADVATVNLVKSIKPYKVVFLSETGGIFNQSDQLIKAINLDLEYEELMGTNWLHSGMKLKLQQIKTLLDFLPKTSSVSITKPINLPKELFTDSGSGTLIKYGYNVEIYDLPNKTVKKDFINVIEKSFGGKLSTEIFNNPESYKIFMTTCKRATISISTNYKIAYMDKFGVLPEAKGEGLGSAIFHEMRKEYPQVFWRSKTNNPINNFYSSISDGYQKTKEWEIYWIGIKDYTMLNDCICYALNKPSSIIYEV